MLTLFESKFFCDDLKGSLLKSVTKIMNIFRHSFLIKKINQQLWGFLYVLIILSTY